MRRGTTKHLSRRLVSPSVTGAIPALCCPVPSHGTSHVGAISRKRMQSPSLITVDRHFRALDLQNLALALGYRSELVQVRGLAAEGARRLALVRTGAPSRSGG